MGTTIMASVNASSFTITSLQQRERPRKDGQPLQYTRFAAGVHLQAYVGTAGATLDRSLAAGLEPIESSFSRIVFSVETILRVAIAMSSLRLLISKKWDLLFLYMQIRIIRIS